MYNTAALVISVGVAGYLAGNLGNLERFQRLLSQSRFQNLQIPPQSFIIDPRQHNVLKSSANRDVISPFNPVNAPTPHFQIWNPAFLDILGSNPSVRLIAERKDFAFAHEAPVYDPVENQVFFSSNNGGTLGMSNWTHNNRIFRIKLQDIDQRGNQNITFEEVPIDPPIQMVNGGTPFGKEILFVGSGRADLPPTLALVNPRPPYNSTTILDNIYSRQFNSLNDAKVHPKSRAIFFTDTIYGFINDFRPSPSLPSQVYRFDPQTGEVRVVADGFDKCNGIAFSPNGKIAYIADSGACVKDGFNPTLPATIYAFDVDPFSQNFINRRVLTWIDTGIPDGIQTDKDGNIYTSCGDGVQVFNPQGVLLGKIFTGMISANHVFAGPGKMIILSETAIFFVEFDAAASLIELE